MRKILLSLVGFCALCALVGCGTSSSSLSVPIPGNPSGGNAAGFDTNAGTCAPNVFCFGNGESYVFSVTGSNPSSNFAVAGTFVTDGHGNITSGTRDTVNDRGGQTLDEAITGTYFVNGDGRGQMVLTGPSSGRAIYRFVLQSPTAQQPSLIGELFQDGTTSDSVVIDATGTFQQVSGAPATPTGTYIIGLSGEDSSLNLYGAVGGITFTGNNIAGFIDENDNGTYAQEAQPQTANGNISLSASRGTATLTTPNGINAATHNFIVYYVSPTEFDLVSTDTTFFLYGNANKQTSFATTNAAFSGDQVFSLSGFDNSGPNSTAAPRVELGRMTLGGGVLTNAIEDYSNYANASPYPGGSLTLGSSYNVSVPADGRWTANLVNATWASNTDLVGWQVSFGGLPQNQKSFVLTTNSTILESGVMLGQTLPIPNAQITGNYAQTLDGLNVSGPTPNYIELTGNLCTGVTCLIASPSGSLSGTYDAQTDNGGLALDTSAFGNYDTGAATFGRSATGNLEGIPVAMYTVDADTILYVSNQQGSIYQGALVNQQ